MKKPIKNPACLRKSQEKSRDDNLVNGSGVWSSCMRGCEAKGTASFAVGHSTISKYDFQFVMGMFNDNSEENYLEIGNGESELERSNCFYISREGKLFAKSFTDGETVKSMSAILAAAGGLDKYLKSATYKNSTLTIVDQDNKPLTIDISPGSSKLDKIQIGETEVKIEDKVAKIGVDGESILYEKDQFKLPDKWIEYLKLATFDVPTISLFGNSESFEYGSTLSITNPFSHKEVNPENIEGSLSLYRNDLEVVTGIAKSGDLQAIIYSIGGVITSNQTFILKATDTMGVTRESSPIVFNCYKPSWYGSSQDSKLSTLDGLVKEKSEVLSKVSFNTKLNDYGYFVVSGTISKVTSDGIEVPVTLVQTVGIKLGSETINYNVYRTDLQLNERPNTFIIE